MKTENETDTKKNDRGRLHMTPQGWAARVRLREDGKKVRKRIVFGTFDEELARIQLEQILLEDAAGRGKPVKTPTFSDLRWWKVTLGSDGAVKTCESVSETLGAGRFIRMVQARSAEEACDIAVAWYKRRHAVDLARRHKREAEARAKGLCISCRKAPHEPDLKNCRKCLDAKNARAAAVKAGAPLAKRRYENPAKGLAAKLEHSKARYVRVRDLTTEVLGFPIDPSFVRKFKELFDSLGPEAFRAKLCEIVPDEVSK